MHPSLTNDGFMNPDLMNVLVCPETRQSLHPADPGLIDNLNRRILAGTLRNRSGQPIKDRLDGGLIREDERVLYPVVGRIPTMIVDEAISLF